MFSCETTRLYKVHKTRAYHRHITKRIEQLETIQTFHVLNIGCQKSMNKSTGTMETTSPIRAGHLL